MTPVPELAQEVADPRTDPEEVLIQALPEMVSHPQYPCLGARSVFHRDRATLRLYDELADPEVAPVLLEDLREFARTTDPHSGFASFVAAFRGPAVEDERHFEQLLWSQLTQLHEADHDIWNVNVSADPTDRYFAFSAAGTAYFIVGLHPRASRDARRTPIPTLVFNLHEQFELLRESGGYPRMRDKIRERDEQLQGTTNPMVADHGASSEACQYSGRRVGVAWEAPFASHEQVELMNSGTHEQVEATDGDELPPSGRTDTDGCRPHRRSGQ